MIYQFRNLNLDHKMKACGANTNGQLGIGHCNDISEYSTCIFANEQITPKYVACGSNHSLVLSSADDLWVSGLNDRGQIGIDSFQVNTFVKLDSMVYRNLVMVAAGWNHSLLLNKDGQVLALGSNDYGQCGVDQSQDIKIPMLVQGIPKISFIVCSLYTSYGIDHDVSFENLCANSKGMIWGWGLNRHGELGIGYRINLSVPRCVVSQYSASIMKCGMHHILFMTHDSKIYGMGSNKSGQLGNSIAQVKSTSEPILVLDGKEREPVDLVAGWSFSGGLMKDGTVYLWGRCDLGQLGVDLNSISTTILKNDKICEMPLLNPHLKNIKSLAGGSEFCFALDSANNLFSWGWNEHGNCGSGDSRIIFVPTRIIHTSLCAAGYGFSFIA